MTNGQLPKNAKIQGLNIKKDVFLKSLNTYRELNLITDKKMNVPGNLKYTKDHEWILVNGHEATIGVTDFAQHELGDIVFIEIETVGERLSQSEVFGTIEAVKTVSDMFMPVSGTITSKNENLDSAAEDVNKDPYGKGWMIKVEIEDHTELDGLLDAEAYIKLIGA